MTSLTQSEINHMPQERIKNFHLNYNPNLLDELHDEHQDLLDHMIFMQDMVAKKEIKLLPLARDLFRGEVLEHVSKEVIQLYVYLRNSLKDQPSKYQQMFQLKNEMDALLLVILNYLDEHKDIQTLTEDKKKQTQFLDHTQKLIELFRQRIEVEESILFPMYQDLTPEASSGAA